MSDFSMAFTLDGTSYTIKGRQDGPPYLTHMASGPHESNSYSVQWFVRINNETDRLTTIYRPVISATYPRMHVLVRTIEAIELEKSLVWYDIIPADDPRLQ